MTKPVSKFFQILSNVFSPSLWARVGIGLFIFALAAFPQTSDKRLQSQINALFKDKYFESTLASIDVYDLTKKKILYQKNNKRLLRPASNTKILTSTAALKYLGEGYQFKTSLYYEGEIVDSILYGHLFVVGGCDPDFVSSDLEVLTVKVKQLGIKKITGNIYGDVSMTDSLFWGNGWMWDDDPSTDAPYMSALNINDNAITIYGAYDYQKNKFVVNSIPETNYIEVIKNFTQDDSKDSHFDVDRDWINRTNKFFINGNFSKNDLTEKSYFMKKLNVYKPEIYFLTLFKEALNKIGIRFTGDVVIKSLCETAKPIFVFSRSFETVIVNLNKTSDNLSAEMTLRALAEKYFGKSASAENGLKMIDSLIILCGLNPNEYRLADGSGVSHYNLVSAELLLSVLKYFYYNDSELFKTLYESFPIAGVDGSLSGRMKNTLAENNVHAKTGTLSGVSCLSGYVKSKKGNMIAFSILVQNYVGNSKQARDFIDAVCEIIAEAK